MNFLIHYVVFLFLFQIQGIKSDDDCEISNFPRWNEETAFTPFGISEHLQKTSIGTVVYNESCQNIQEVAITNEEKVYFSISFQDETKSRLIIESTEKLSNIDTDFRHVESHSVSTTTMIKFTCKNNKDRQAQFTIYVDDVNSNKPEFSKTSYEFALPMPMPAKIPLTMFGEQTIMVRDKDFSTTDITFTSDYTNLVFKTIYNQNKDNINDYPYTLQMNFGSFTRLDEDTKVKIVATDNGYPNPQSTEIEISFLIDHQESEYVVTFEQPSFLYDYNQNKGSISPETHDVTIVNPTTDIECELAELYRDYFETPVVTESVVEFELKGKFPDNIVSQKTLRVTLTCSIPSGIKSSADVLISMPEIKVLFSKSSYNAKYITEEGVNKIDMTDVIEVIGNADEIRIEVENKYQDFFEVNLRTDASNEWVLQKKKDLTEELLDDISLNIVIDIVSSSGSFSDKAIIILLLPNGQTGVKFTNSFMTGDYVVDENGQGKLTADIHFELTSENVKINDEKLLGEYNDCFDVKYQEPKTFTVTLKSDLPKEALKSNTILLTLQVDLSLGAVSQTAEATFVVQVSDSSTTTEPSTTTQQPTTTKSTTSVTEHTTTEHTTKGSETSEPPVPTKEPTNSPTVTTSKTETPTEPPVPTKEPTNSPTVTTSKTETPTEPTVSTKQPTNSPTVTTSKTKPPTKTPTDHTSKQPTESPVISTTKKTETADDCDYTVWIVVTIVLGVLLVLYIGASLLYYFKRMRNRNINENFPDQPEEEMEDHFKKKTSHLKSSLKNVATRRPTGFPVYNPMLEKEDGSEKSDTETENNTIANRRATPPPPPMPTTDSENSEKSENFKKLNETLADAIKKAVLKRESRLI